MLHSLHVPVSVSKVQQCSKVSWIPVSGRTSCKEVQAKNTTGKFHQPWESMSQTASHECTQPQIYLEQPLGKNLLNHTLLASTARFGCKWTFYLFKTWNKRSHTIKHFNLTKSYACWFNILKGSAAIWTVSRKILLFNNSTILWEEHSQRCKFHCNIIITTLTNASGFQIDSHVNSEFLV